MEFETGMKVPLFEYGWSKPRASGTSLVSVKITPAAILIVLGVIAFGIVASSFGKKGPAEAIKTAWSWFLTSIASAFAQALSAMAGVLKPVGDAVKDAKAMLDPRNWF
jgi:hypothetical protein